MLIRCCVRARSGRSEGTATVVFDDKAEASRAKNRYTNMSLDGKVMKLELVEGAAGPVKKLSSGIMCACPPSPGGFTLSILAGSGWHAPARLGCMGGCACVLACVRVCVAVSVAVGSLFFGSVCLFWCNPCVGVGARGENLDYKCQTSTE